MSRLNMSDKSRKVTPQICASVLQWWLALLIATTFLLNGAVDPAVRPPLTILFSVGSLLVLLLPLENGPVRPLIRRALLLCFGLSLWVGVQALPLPLWLPVHTVWRDLSATLGTEFGYLSVNPSTTWNALPSLILPFMVFVTSIMLTQSDTSARSFWHKLTYVGLLVVVVSVVRQVFFPDTVAFSGQALRTGQFSGVFINRNVAASAFGLTGFALLGTLAIQLAHDPSLQKLKHKKHQSRNFWTYVFFASALFLIAVCLILTRSRAGSLVSLVLLLPCLTLILRHGLRERLTNWQPWRRRATSVVVALVSLIIFLAAFGEPVLSRVEISKDTARWCTWGATIAAIKDHLLLGTGFGTFRDIFPLYRDPTCDGAEVIWLRAHNSFLELYLGLGLPAVIVAGVACISVGQTILTGLRTRKSLKGIPIAMAGAFIFIVAHSLVDFPLQIPGIALYFAALMGVGSALCMQRCKTVRSGNHTRLPSTNKEEPLGSNLEIRLS